MMSCIGVTAAASIKADSGMLIRRCLAGLGPRINPVFFAVRFGSIALKNYAKAWIAVDNTMNSLIERGKCWVEIQILAKKASLNFPFSVKIFKLFNFSAKKVAILNYAKYIFCHIFLKSIFYQQLISILRFSWK